LKAKVERRLLKVRLRSKRHISFRILWRGIYLVLGYFLGMRRDWKEEVLDILVGRVGTLKLRVNNTEVFLVLLCTLADRWEVEDINMVVIDMNPHQPIRLLLQHHLMRPLTL
jgi:hypothetical protein